MTPGQQDAYDKAQIMLAYARGEKVEADYSNHPTGWEACDDPCWDWAAYDYRIAPAPKPSTP